jgi:hypothetical protein
MIRTSFFAITLMSLLCLEPSAFAEPAPATQPSTRPMVDPVADQILRQSCDYLAQTKAFAVHAEVWKDQVLASGHKIQVTRSIDVDLRRPDGFHFEARAHHKGRSIWYDGKSLTVLDRETNLYGSVDAPATVDETLDLLSAKYGITVPLEDLLVADPYGSAMKNVTAGGYFGDEPVLGVACRHIGFSTDSIDWQLWVADSPQPLVQKLVITYKTEDQSPQYIAIFSKWNLLDRASDLPFKFIPPHGSAGMPLVAQKEKDRP